MRHMKPNGVMYSLQNKNKFCIVKMILRDRSVHLPDDATRVFGRFIEGNSH